jgi:hypothetical protein
VNCGNRKEISGKLQGRKRCVREKGKRTKELNIQLQAGVWKTPEFFIPVHNFCISFIVGLCSNEFYPAQPPNP